MSVRACACVCVCVSYEAQAPSARLQKAEDSLAFSLVNTAALEVLTAAVRQKQRAEARGRERGAGLVGS